MHYFSLLLFIPLAFTHVIWNKPNDWNAGLPSSIQAFQTNTSYVKDVPMYAAYCEMDLRDPDFELKVVHSEGKNLKTLQEYIDDEPNQVYMAVNGGYFNIFLNISISLVISKGEVVYGGATTVTEFTRSPPRYLKIWHPTRGAFGVHANGSMEITYTYDVGSHEIYAYPQPAPICDTCTRQPLPSKTFPQGGKRWEVIEALGAGPILIKDGIRNSNLSMTQEAFSTYITQQRHPRTGICITHEGKVITIVIDGRSNTSGGLFLEELAGLMEELGCKDALNFDGGRSGSLIVNGVLTNHPPTDDHELRGITSAMLLVSRTKPKLPKEQVVQ